MPEFPEGEWPTTDTRISERAVQRTKRDQEPRRLGSALPGWRCWTQPVPGTGGDLGIFKDGPLKHEALFVARCPAYHV